VILVPLATWIFLLLVVILYFHSTRRGGKYVYQEPRKRRCGLCRTIIYAIFLFCAFGMTVLEVVRLELAKLGIGLLPFCWAAFLIAGLLYFSHGLSGRFPTYWIANSVLWLLLMAMNGVKIAEELKEGINTRKGTKYPMSDEVIDVAVQMGVYLVLLIAELLR
jgi:hypothetical protein